MSFSEAARRFAKMLKPSLTLLPMATAVGVPAAPAHASETPQVRCDRSLGSPLMGKDAALGFCDLSFQIGDAFFGLAGRTGGLANGKPGGFQGLHGITVLFELNPMPGNVAITVSCHARRPWWSPRRRFRRITIDGSWLTIG
jgi:hypothetical protein